MARAKKALIILGAIGGLSATYFSHRAITASLMDRDGKLLQKATSIARCKDGNPLYFTREEHCDFLCKLGVKVSQNEVGGGTFSYTVRRGIFLDSEILVYLGDAYIGSFTSKDLERFVGSTR